MSAVNLDTLIKEKLGASTTSVDNPTASTVGTSVITLLRQNPSRIAFSVINLSANDLYISPRNDVSSAKGFRIRPNGGRLSFVWDEDFDLVGREWHAVASGAASDVLVVEQNLTR